MEILELEALVDLVINKANKIKKYCHQSRAKVKADVSTSTATKKNPIDDARIASVIAQRESRRKFKTA